ncbi:discoidin domain-containing protein [Actinacidiphila sp. ITFR-21]|uniref:discoidin domain-containing protein n=1 Tax=Actinacidiphila sp. ITFR-21 TaxID=3075199 RepID=UPI00288A5D75|nr:discoidin domain-containing protein [Streptomyces sp. ITFR-21]WNI18981.1 discoidin domain-containing protein [Streptomyces sp. ITFR-21]
MGAVAAAVLACSPRCPAPAARRTPPGLSQGRPATASSTENAGTLASAAVDGNAGTRWSSAAADQQWLQVDLGAGASVTQVVLQREAAYASGLQIQVSDNGTTWNPVYFTTTTTTGTGGKQTLTVSGTGRTSGCTAPRGPPDTATPGGSSRSTRSAA